MASIRLSVRVRGRVQGVGFRYFTMRAARELGVAGWVRNEADGTVLCEVAGDPETVEAFLAEVRRGPRFSRVDEVATESLKSGAAEPDFEIR